MLTRSLILLAAAAVPSFAQGASPEKTHTRNALLLFNQVRDYIVQSAADMPENAYSFKPTPDVRSFGELIGHIAGAQRVFCASALGETPPAEDAIEKSAKTKAALIAALKESNDYCARAYQQTDAAAAAPADIFGTKATRMLALLENVTHDNEHYGNIVTYMRMNKLVPPSSRPRPSGD